MNTAHDLTKKNLVVAANDTFGAFLDDKANKETLVQQFLNAGRIHALELKRKAEEAGANREAVRMFFDRLMADPIGEDGLMAEEALEELVKVRLEEKKNSRPKTADGITLHIPNELAELEETLSANLKAGKAYEENKAAIESWIETQLAEEKPLDAEELKTLHYKVFSEQGAEATMKILEDNYHKEKNYNQALEKTKKQAWDLWETLATPYRDELGKVLGEWEEIKAEYEATVEELEQILNIKQPRKTPSAGNTGGGAIIIDGMSNRAYNKAQIEEGIYTKNEIITMSVDAGYGEEKVIKNRLNGLLSNLRKKGKLIEREDGTLAMAE